MSKSGKPMNKTLKGIFAGCGLLAVLGGGLLALKLTEPAPEQEESSTAEDYVLFWSVDSCNISQIRVKQPHGDTYTANRKVETVQTTDANGNPTEEEVENYYLEGYESLPMNTTEIRMLATRSPELYAIETVEKEPADLAKYGLDDPITVNFEVDGSDPIEFYVGDPTPVSTYSYIQVKGDPAVYTVGSTSVAPFRESLYHYLGLTLREEQADDDDTIIESVRIERRDLDYDFYFVYDGYFVENSNGGAMALHVMEEPVHCLLSADKSAGATHGIYGLTANAVVQPFPKEADLTKMGFDEPFVRVTMKTDDGKTTEFLLGNTYETEDGETYYYGKLSDVDCVYGFAPDAIVYDDLKPQDITAKNIVDFYVWDLSHIRYQAGDTVLDFTGQGEDQDDFVLKLNGEVYEDNERFRQLYAFMLEAKAEDLILEETEIPDTEPLASVLIERQDGARSYDIAFYDAGGMKAYIAVNGEIRYRCRRSYVDTLISNIEIFNTDKAFTTTW